MMDDMAPLERPHLRGGGPHATRVVLIFHGGREHGTRTARATQSTYLRMLDFYAALRRAASDQTAVYLLRHRVRGWNPDTGRTPDPVVDGQWALVELARRHPRARVALLGHSMGGRTAFALASHESVVGVCGLAPWLPVAEPLPDPAGSTGFVIAHGTSDRMTSAPLSLAYAERLRDAGGRVARFELAGGKHALLDHAGLWRRFAVTTTLGLVGDAPLPERVASALSPRTGPLGLNEPLTA
jgi:acetyl esterase/lipase